MFIVVSQVKHRALVSVASRGLRSIVNLIALASFGAIPGFAAPGDFLFTLRSPAPTNQEQFGSALVRHGSEILIGAPHDQGPPPNPGTIFRYDVFTGAYLGAIANLEPADYDGFGKTMASPATRC